MSTPVKPDNTPVAAPAQSQEKSTITASPAVTLRNSRESGPNEKEVLDLAPVTSNVEIEYIKGFKLISVMIALILAVFLMLLDVSILVTVSFRLAQANICDTVSCSHHGRQFPELLHNFTRYPILVGMEPPIIWRGKRPCGDFQK